ncbi:unnamed protein product [Dovyalis caffra]|uniref:Uncharacterized protein n=1 Tax=Dovyalis caffra TaxID=77055 RepID=A0AAV1SDI1_9ROSI|nr:unnamed protein product [Dovyalis caffra]
MSTVSSFSSSRQFVDGEILLHCEDPYPGSSSLNTRSSNFRGIRSLSTTRFTIGDNATTFCCLYRRLFPDLVVLELDWLVGDNLYCFRSVSRLVGSPSYSTYSHLASFAILE